MNFTPIVRFFTPKAAFSPDEWLLCHQITAMLLLSFFFGLAVLPFAYVRFHEGNYIVAASQLLLGTFLLYGFMRLRKDKTLYRPWSIAFFLLFFLYTAIVFFYVPQNHLNILWIVTAPILIFFFMNKRGGVVMFIIVMLFILYLILSGYPYTVAEFITLTGAFLTTTFIMYIYEFVKESEKKRILRYNAELQREVEKQTLRYKKLNSHLQERVAEEVAKQTEQEQMLLMQCRMASMGQMMAAIAHQWRQPLMNINAILLNIDHSIETKPLDEHYLHGRIDEIASITTHMSQTIEDFRNLFKPKQEKSSFLLQETVQEVLTLLKNNLKTVAVTLHIPETPILLYGYKGEMIQVLIILLSNAVDILHSRKVHPKQIDIRTRREKGRIILDISDNAGGISKEIMHKIFDPYFTTKQQTGGTGLGLYIAKIITEHNFGGTLSVANTPDGAQFTLTIPHREETS